MTTNTKRRLEIAGKNVDRETETERKGEKSVNSLLFLISSTKPICAIKAV